MKPDRLTVALLAITLVPAIVGSNPAIAQIDLSQPLTGSFSSTFTSTQTHSTQSSNIVISIRDFSSNDNFCGNSVSFSLSRPGSFGDGFDFPHAGRQAENFSHPGRTITAFPGGATTYFQLPVGVRNPDLIGCVDTQRNTVFITIRSQRQVMPTMTQPQPQPSLPPIQPPFTQTAPSNVTPIDPQTQIRLPRQMQSFPSGVSSETPSIR